MTQGEYSIEVAQMDAAGRLTVAIKRLAERDTEIERLRAREQEMFQKYVDAKEALYECAALVEAMMDKKPWKDRPWSRITENARAVSIIRRMAATNGERTESKL